MIILLTLYCTEDQIGVRWAGHVARMGESRVVYWVLVGTPEGKNPLGRPRHKWEDNIKMDLQEVGCEGMDWIDVAQDRDEWQALVNVKLISSFKTYISNQHCKRGYMFRFTEPSSGQLLKQSIFSECTHYGIPYFLQVILILKITLNSVGRCII